MNQATAHSRDMAGIHRWTRMRKTDNALSWLRSNRFPSALLIPGLPQQHTGDDQMFVLRPNDGQVFHNPLREGLPTIRPTLLVDEGWVSAGAGMRPIPL